MPVPNSFANVTTSIPLSQLDANFNTPITLGNTAIQLGNTVTTLNNMTLANVTVSSGNVTITNVTVTTANVTTANIATAQIANVTVSGTGTFAAGSNTAPSITTSGDTNTGIFFPAADTIAFTEGGVESMRITSAGDVGIGTSTPATISNRTVLSINNASNGGALNLLVNGTETLRLLTDNSSFGYVYNIANQPLLFGTNNTERMRIDTSGNLGLGVTPSAWSASQSVLQFGTTGRIAFSSTANSISSNAYNNSGWKYVGTGNALLYAQDTGSHIWYNSASGTAGNAITFTQAMTLSAAGDLGVGITSNTAGFRGQFVGDSAADNISVGVRNTNTTGYTRFVLGNNISVARFTIGYTGSTASAPFGASLGYLGTEGNEPFLFQTNGTERARIDSVGDFFVGKTTANTGTNGFQLTNSGTELSVGRSSNRCALFNRNTTDGDIVLFLQDGAQEGSISVSGNTVSYNPFLGSHAGAFADWSRPEVKIGTIFETINELIDYKVVAIEVEDVPKRISYNGNGAVGTTATVEYEGQEYTGIIENERGQLRDFNKHVKVKINDTPDSKAVYGVFVGWNTDPSNDGGVYNDMLIGAVGNYVIRMAAGQTPEIGDLVKADGTGCAIVQEDDIVRTKTVGKITNTIPQLTYEDGSFLVACVLYCG